MTARRADMLIPKPTRRRRRPFLPAPAWLLDTLARFGAECEDREPSLEDEPETDSGIEDEPELDRSDWEPGNDDEPETDMGADDLEHDSN